MNASIRVGALAIVAALVSPATAQGPRVDEPFPVRLYPRVGKAGLHSIADFRGKKILLIQFASW